jgi:hypothetical protein
MYPRNYLAKRVAGWRGVRAIKLLYFKLGWVYRRVGVGCCKGLS